jgi:hypothetical protein
VVKTAPARDSEPSGACSGTGSQPGTQARSPSGVKCDSAAAGGNDRRSVAWFAHVSRNETVRLKTGAPSRESRESTQK